MSTLSCQLLVCSSALTEDFYRGFLRPRASERELVWIGRAMVLGIALVAIFTIPVSTAFFELVDPSEECAYLVAVVTVVTVGAIEIVRFFHRRYVARSLAVSA